MSKEAWKDSGNCKDCRRAKYCRKPCTANARRAKEKAEQAARAALAKTRREDMMRAIMESMRKEPVHFERKIIIHGAMIYGCQDCGTRWVMYLEKGLEEKNCPDRKPVPFGIQCPFCGGFHGYDISGYIPLPDTDYAELPDGESCFVNLPDRDCGTPRYADPPRKF